MATPLLAVVIAFAAEPTAERTGSLAAEPVVDSTTRVQMQNVDYYVDPQIRLKIRSLLGHMRSRTGGPILFDDKTAFIISIARAEIGLTGPDMSVLLNKYVFGFKDSPLSNLKVSISGNEMVQKGTLRNVARLPFVIRAVLSATPDGRIRIHPTRIEILGLHVDKLMKGLGLSLDKIIDLSKAKGATVDGNDILLNPTSIMPPPAIQGKVTGIRLDDDQIVMEFGDAAGAALAVSDTLAHNYMYYRGGTLRFGKLMMLDADMLITDLDPADPFRFDLARYQPQLIAGYSKSLASGGLEVFMKDIDKLSASRAASR